MKIFKNYKKLYKIVADNCRVLQERNEDLYKREIVYQEQAKKHEKTLREQIAKLKIELEDTVGFLEQEKQCSNALRKERTKLRAKIKKLGGEWKDGTKKRN